MNEELNLNKLENTIVFTETYSKDQEILREFHKINKKLDILLKLFEKNSEKD